jgi:hypothetical protein
MTTNNLVIAKDLTKIFNGKIKASSHLCSCNTVQP